MKLKKISSHVDNSKLGRNISKNTLRENFGTYRIFISHYLRRVSVFLNIIWCRKGPSISLGNKLRTMCVKSSLYFLCFNIASVGAPASIPLSFSASFHKSDCRVCEFVRLLGDLSLWMTLAVDLLPPSAEGPCLVHTITGDLLRALEGPENCLFPRLISVSSEGHCIIYYERGRFSNFSINGKLLAQMEINDSTRVGLCVQCWPGTEAIRLKTYISH